MAFQDWGSDLTSGICRLGGLMLKVDADTELSAPQEPPSSTISQEVFHQTREQHSKVDAIMQMTLKSNVMTLCSDYERQLETYERLKDKLQLALTAEMHTATLQGLAASGKRLQKKLAEITTLAEQGHIDITDQIQDFIQRQA
jgi:hypothetical protein